MTKNSFTNLKTPVAYSIKDMYKSVDSFTLRNSKVFRLAFQKRYKTFLILPFLGYFIGTNLKNIEGNHLKSTLNQDDIRYNREFQRMRFLDEPKFNGHKENSLTRQMMVDSGSDMTLHPSRKDLVKKNPHYKYF